ncbi:hybrid sensor histidine kinase/response regulator [Leptolyngbya sp. 'hensonii']|uniref:hybrid sensor histidine kinase/response regulator n=1 Tax=Leptolyngbya sp. 'hensonii' TaxID=1922337 RepID=UPI001C0ACEBE|nr:hybrid sensor histidine kinase/response regulator [Leptolyngbya sp. 'hensonii']
MLGQTTPVLNPLQPIRILVVEDEMIIARDIQGCLENLGYVVSAVVPSGLEAIETAAASRPDLVLMDIRLKGTMDGIQAAEQIWKRFQIPIIYSTGYSDPKTLQRAKETGPFGYVLKPVEERELFVAIETALHRYRLEQDLQQREQWLTTILRGIGDGVIVTDEWGYVKFLNPIAEAITGWWHADAYDQLITEVFQLLHEETRQPLSNPILQALQRGVPVYPTDTALLQSRKGQEIPISDSAAPLRDDRGAITGAVLVFRDVTQRRLAAEHPQIVARAQEMEVQMAELQRLSQMKDDFLSTVSHELRTPLTSIILAINMLEVSLKIRAQSNLADVLLPDRVNHYLGILREQSRRELDLVNDLLDFQRLSANAYPLDWAEIPLATWLPSRMEDFRERAEVAQLQLQVDLPSDLPILISDAAGLNRIMAELLNNACKYTPPGGKITVAIAQGADAAAPGLAQCPAIQITVTNTGIEIPDTELPRVFDQFYRVPCHDRWREGGTGLGLALVKKMVEHLGGSIRVTSGAGATCFTVELPLRPDPALYQHSN